MGRTGGIVLAGGGSTRMGRPKASLEWHGSTLLRRVAGLVLRGVDGPVVVVRSAGQELPPLPDGLEVASDSVPGRGPVAGLAAGLGALGDRVDRVFVAATDMPWLHPAFVRAVMAAMTEQTDVAVPFLGDHRHPLAAAYRADVAELVDQNLSVGRLRLSSLFDVCRVVELDAGALLRYGAVAEGDPELRSVDNLNSEADYAEALARPEPAVTVTDGRAGDAGSSVTTQVSTLGAAVDAIGWRLDPEQQLSLNGRPVAADPELPLANGDEVTLR